MNGSDFHQQPATTISSIQPYAFEPMRISPWLAMAILQKGIRRGANEVAQEPPLRCCVTRRISYGDVAWGSLLKISA